MTPLLAALAVMALLTGLLLVAVGVRPAAPAAAPRRTGVTRASRSGRWTQLTPRTRRLLAVGLGAGVLVWLTTGWAVAVLVLPVAAAGLPAVLLPPQADASIDRLEAMEEWTRALAGVLTVGVGLQQAIIATLRSTPEPIRPEVATLVARLRAQWPAAAALRAFADDLDDATGDLIASSLLLGAQRQGDGLADVLEGLAQTVAQDVRIRRSIEAERAGPRASARWITLISVGVLGVSALRGDYIAPYGTPVGQLVLFTLLCGYAGALMWMRSIARGAKLPRFIGQQVAQRSGRPA